MLDRRSFLRRTSLALAGGLVLGPEALEAFERLTHRKVFALGGVPGVKAPKGSLYIDRSTGGLWVSVVSGSGSFSEGQVGIYTNDRAPGNGWVRVTA